MNICSKKTLSALDTAWNVSFDELVFYREGQASVRSASVMSANPQFVKGAKTAVYRGDIVWAEDLRINELDNSVHRINRSTTRFLFEVSMYKILTTIRPNGIQLFEATEQ